MTTDDTGQGPAPTILVVDDDADIVALLQVALEDAGYVVASAVGADALRAARDLRPSLILLDIMMPGMDGVEVSWRLRAEPATADIPIVIMSAQERLRSAATFVPASARLAKPFDLDTLYATVRRWARG